MGAKLIVATEALASGELTRRDLSRVYVKVYRNVYVRNGVPLSAVDRARAAWLWSGREAVLVGHSAAALLGSKWVSDDAPVEIGRFRHPAARGILVHSGIIRDDELRHIGPITCTTPARTAYDLGRRLPHDASIIHVDALLNATGCTVDEVGEIAARYTGARGIRRLRSALALADAGAESPPETRLRLLLVRSGLPRPVTQVKVGRRRVDIGYPEFMVGVEYDGEQHWTDPDRYAEDIERLEYLAAQGWIIVRVSARQSRYDPDGIVERVLRALRSRGYDAERTLVCAPTRDLRTRTVRSA
ncbi:MAG TPA: DUF559 domain-containing protein [Mycobacterium sp.]|nr:DUF559 domain-containing protein [Mycobacterium sp.]